MMVIMKASVQELVGGKSSLIMQVGAITCTQHGRHNHPRERNREVDAII